VTIEGLNLRTGLAAAEADKLPTYIAD
jgi:hypothetical protein